MSKPENFLWANYLDSVFPRKKENPWEDNRSVQISMEDLGSAGIILREYAVKMNMSLQYAAVELLVKGIEMESDRDE